MSKADEVRQRIVDSVERTRELTADAAVEKFRADLVELFKSMDDRACLDCACYLRAAEVVKTFKAAL